MPKARKQQINPNLTLFYHCISRCVRRSFLCGNDKYSGKNYEHRRQWVEDRIHTLATVFCIDVCAYAVMSNHTHLVLRIHPSKAIKLSDLEVIQRWHGLYKGTLLTQKFAQGFTLNEVQTKTVNGTIKVWRQRLSDISWFMRGLNEHIARQANKEDKCTGRFWEGRFKSQSILGKSALAACLVYVDLNPVRAQMSDSPEKSDHTSIQYRINAAKVGKPPKFLLPFTGDMPLQTSIGLPFSLPDYLRLVDETGRAMSNKSRGVVAHTLSPILTRLNIGAEQWHALATSLETNFAQAIGDENQLLHYQQMQQLKRLWHKQAAKRLFG